MTKRSRSKMGQKRPPSPPQSRPISYCARVLGPVVALYRRYAALLLAIAIRAKSNPVRDDFIGLGFPLAAYGVGFAMMFASPDLFWFGAYISLFACFVALAIWMVLSWYSRPELRIVGYLPSSLFALLVLWLMFRPVPSSIEFVFIPDRYQSGANIDGIKWKDEFSELVAVISNNTAMRFDNITV
jgi:hypothetical protein